MGCQRYLVTYFLPCMMISPLLLSAMRCPFRLYFCESDVATEGSADRPEVPLSSTVAEAWLRPPLSLAARTE